jgi:hypothetical protein
MRISGTGTLRFLSAVPTFVLVCNSSGEHIAFYGQSVENSVYGPETQETTENVVNYTWCPKKYNKFGCS